MTHKLSKQVGEISECIKEIFDIYWYCLYFVNNFRGRIEVIKFELNKMGKSHDLFKEKDLK